MSTTTFSRLPLPEFFNPANADNWDYCPNAQQLLELAVAWRKEHNILPAGLDERRIRLLIVDAQNDFCQKKGKLFVAGRSGIASIEDSQRLCAFIYQYLYLISQLTITVDKHPLYYISFATFFVDADNNPLSCHRTITMEDLQSGRVRPNPDIASWLCDGDYQWLCDYVEFYCAELARKGNYDMHIWPPHCLAGTAGQNMVGVIMEAVIFHSLVRQIEPLHVEKGNLPLFDHYSPFSTEVAQSHDGRVQGDHLKKDLILQLLQGVLITAGQAGSHCFRSAMDDILTVIQETDPVLANNVYILIDCTSAVVVRDAGGNVVADFTEDMEAAFARYAAAGMHLVKSTDPIETWPGFAK